MILPIVLLITGVVALLAFLLYGRAYWWAYRASRWRDVDQALAAGNDDGTASPARRLSKAERKALGTPISNALVALLAIFSTYGAIALFRSGDPDRAVYGAVCAAGLVLAVVLFALLDRLPTVVRARSLRGVLTYPSADMTYVPPGGMYVHGVPVLYSLHWDRFIQADVGQVVEIELTEQGDVLRHGSVLSLDREAARFNLRPWVPAAHAAIALTVLFIAGIVAYFPITERIDTARQAISAHRYLTLSTPSEWQAWTPRVGDEVTAHSVTASCGLRTAPLSEEGGMASLFNCERLSVGVPAQAAAMPAVTPLQQTAEALSLQMEQLLLTRRNATSEEVRRYFRQAGLGSSQRYTLPAVAPVAAAIDRLCSAGECPARAALDEALAAPAAQNPDTADGALVMDGRSATRLVQAAFALAAQSLDDVSQAAIKQAHTVQQTAAWQLHSSRGTALASLPPAIPLANATDQALLEQVGLQSPRLRLLVVQQAIRGLDQHPVRWAGVVREVDEQARPVRVGVDTDAIPTAVWVKFAPLVLLLALMTLAVLAGVTGVAQRRAQRRHIAAITADYEKQQTTPP